MKFYACLVPLLCLAAGAFAQHADIRPRAQSGRIVTDGWIDATQQLLTEARVFGFDFGEDPLDPWFAADPGFNAAAGSGLPPGQPLWFAASGPLLYWDGAGPATLVDAPADTSIRLNLGLQSQVIGPTSAGPGGFALATIDSAGALHRHLNAFLQSASPAGPPDGVYVFSMTLAAQGLDDSPPFFIVFNSGLPEAAHDQAMQWVESELVPEPALAPMLIPLLLALRRRRYLHRGQVPCSTTSEKFTA